MENKAFKGIQKELTEHESVPFEIFSDPVGYNEFTGGRVGQRGPYFTSISQIVKMLLPDWPDARIQNAIKRMESRGLIEGLSSAYNVLRTDRGITLLENWLTEKGKGYAQWLALTSEH